MKKKKKKFSKILLSLTVIFYMIPFIFINVNAATPEPQTYLTWAYSFMSNDNTSYMYCDLYLVSNRVISNVDIVITNNRVYRLPATTSISFEIIECDGITSMTRNNTYNGSKEMQTWNINLQNTSYMQVRIVYQDTEANLRAVIATPQYYTAVQFYNSSNYTYTAYEANTTKQIELIRTYLYTLVNSGLTVDMTETNALLQQLIDLQTGNQESSESIDNNDNITSDFNDISGQYNELESDFNSDFNSNLELIDPGTLSDQLDSWTNSVTWYRTQMDNIYSGLGQFQFIATLALLLSIALIFIGR